jgi:uncharacterized iron-regulated membrane protein
MRSHRWRWYAGLVIAVVLILLVICLVGLGSGAPH